MNKAQKIDTTYNGWTNWETWNCNLWLNNDELTYNTCLELIELHKDKKYHRYEISHALKDLWQDLTENGYVKDKISTHRIDFYEIADTFLTI